MEVYLERFVLYLSFIVTSGVLIIAILKVWEKVFDLALQMFNMKKEFISFAWDKYHTRNVVTPKPEDICFKEEV